VAAAVAHNVADYSQLNVEAGFSYDSGAIVDDGSEPGPTLDSPTAFKPTARPGYHLPHAWLSDGEHDVSAVDLVSCTGLTLFVTESGAGAWRNAVDALRQRSNSPLTTVVLGESTGIRDPGGAYRRAAVIEADGALPVGPDKHVAWRSANLPADPAAALTEAVTAVPAGRARPAPGVMDDRLSTITNAGGTLRSGRGRDSRTFDDSTM
jgi:2,4-dichlorophenol 6-monooxygenase